MTIEFSRQLVRSGLASKHIANELSRYAYAYGSNLWMDPGSEEVQTRTLNTIIDVVTRYDIDGVHFDDYFYPYPVSGQDFPDSATYNAYRAGGGQLSRDDWRHHNIDSFVQTLSQRIKATRPWVKFGISPFGIWMSGHPHGVVGFSSNSGQYADSRKWLSEGWVDYLSPQLYWKIDPPQQSFTALSDWWIQQNSRQRHLYPGVGTYRIADSHQWPISEIERQVQETRARADQNDLGDIFFSAKYYKANTRGIADTFRTALYNRPAIAPVMQWLQSDITTVAVPAHVTASGELAVLRQLCDQAKQNGEKAAEFLRNHHERRSTVPGLTKEGRYERNYLSVYDLMTHAEDMQTEDMFQYSLLVCNAHAITALHATQTDEGSAVETQSQVRVATAIYPTASLMNHSCDPTIISSFIKDVLVVKSVKDVPIGGEIFNCYGRYAEAADHLTSSLRVTESLYGADSVELTRELHKMAEVQVNAGRH
nr:hypothetical protein BaRGS_014388 [Batillaria attramentaria]